MAKSPFSSAGGGSADTSPYSECRKNGGRLNLKAAPFEGDEKKIASGDDEDARPRLDRKSGGCARKRGGRAPVKGKK